MSDIWLTDASDLGKVADASTKDQVESALAAAEDLRESDPLIKRMREVTASVNSDASGEWTRVKELTEFAKRMNVEKIGIAFCAGLKEEAAILRDILESHGLTVCGVACAVEGPCNSMGQAQVLNALGTDLNVLLGLCLGHDAAFLKQADAPTTVIGVKDKVTCHNPVAALTCPYQRKKLMGV